jgi:predicted NAD-dependent protein-ADP-ribosyltransferase YbiA (DUF1768 family)
MHREYNVLNVSSGSSDWRCYALSNFPCFPFELDGAIFVSVEGFIQGIKFPEEYPQRWEAFNLWGKKAKLIGEDARRANVWWKGSQIPYGSTEHHLLIGRAIAAKFHCNSGARFALASTGNAKLVHNVGPESPHTSLPADIFCKILTDLRSQLRG